MCSKVMLHSRIACTQGLVDTQGQCAHATECCAHQGHVHSRAMCTQGLCAQGLCTQGNCVLQGLCTHRSCLPRLKPYCALKVCATQGLVQLDDLFSHRTSILLRGASEELLIATSIRASCARRVASLKLALALLIKVKAVTRILSPVKILLLSDSVMRVEEANCALKVCALKVCALKVCALKVCALKVCALKVCALKVCALKVCALKVCPLKVRALKVCALKVCALKGGFWIDEAQSTEAARKRKYTT